MFVGCYPVNMQPATASTWDLSGTYWYGDCGNLAPQIQYYGHDFVYKIEAAAEGTDQYTYGGYTMYQWNGVGIDPEWEEMDYVYIYSNRNHTIKADRASLDGMTFDGHYEVDLDKHGNYFVVDAGDNARFIMVMWDESDPTHLSVYQDDQNFNTGADWGPQEGIPDYTPLGWPAISPDLVTYYPFRVTDMYVLPTEADQPYYHTIAGVNGNPPLGVGNEVEQVCGFLLYRASATPNGTDWDISPDFALPGMHQGQFCVSASFMDNPAVWLVNAERYDDSKDLPANSGENTNYIVVGASNPTFQFSRCTFTNLHIPKILGVEDMPTKDGEVVQTTIGNWVVKVTDTNVKYGYIWELLRGSKDVQKDEWTINSIGTNRNYLLNYSIGGISIDSMYGESTTTNNTDLDNMTLLTKDNWGNCLLYKLGFAYEDLFPTFGEPTNIYDYSKIKSSDPAVRYEKLKPLTTNPLIDISSATSLPVQDGTVEEPNPSDEDNPYEQVGMGLPTYSLSVGSLIPTNLDAQTSEAIIAKDLPIKQSTPYYTIYCSLSSGDYISNTDAFQILGIIQKRFIAGDYVYGDPSPPMVVKLNQKVTRIEIEIRDNAGKAVSLNDNNTVILMIQKRLPE